MGVQVARREDVWTCRGARVAVGESDRKTGRQEMTSGNRVGVDNTVLYTLRTELLYFILYTSPWLVQLHEARGFLEWSITLTTRFLTLKSLLEPPPHPMQPEDSQPLLHCAYTQLGG